MQRAEGVEVAAVLPVRAEDAQDVAGRAVQGIVRLIERPGDDQLPQRPGARLSSSPAIAPRGRAQGRDPAQLDDPQADSPSAPQARASSWAPAESRGVGAGALGSDHQVHSASSAHRDAHAARRARRRDDPAPSPASRGGWVRGSSGRVSWGRAKARE